MRLPALFSILTAISIMPRAVAAVLSLAGGGWMIKDAADSGSVPFCPDWLPAKVPGNVQADLEAARRLLPIWYGAGDARLYEVAKRDWYYRKDFEVPAGFGGDRVRLIFDGVDNRCVVWLNGHRLGGNSSMFTRFEFEVRDKLRVGETNRLELRLERIPEELIPYIEKSDGPAMLSGAKWRFTNGMQKSLDLLKEMKSGTNFGYDWGVNIWTLGIWKDVRLESSGSAVIRHVKIETPLTNDYTKASVVVNAVVDSLAKETAKLRLRVSGHGADLVSEQPLALVAGANTLQTRIELPSPALWWPNGQGKQNLYTLEATVVDSSGRESHVLRSRFGVREVRWEPTVGAPEDYPEKYLPIVNGRPIRMIGSNLIPPDLLFSRIPERAPHLLRMAHLAGFNALRLWGGGVLYDSSVYDLADELGLMLMFEIFMANIDPLPDPALLKNLDAALPNIIRQVWNHPSIIEYTGGNEMNYGKGSGDYSVIRHIRKIFSEVDPSRIFRDTDPANGSTHGTWNYPLDPTNPVDPAQVYTAWNKLQPLLEGGRERSATFPITPDFSRGIFYIKGQPPAEWARSMRYGEFGYQTPAHLEVWRRDIPASSQWPIKKHDSILIRKNATHAIVVFDDETWLERPVIERLFGLAPDLDYFLKAGQFVGAEGLRYAIDAIRRRGAATGAMLTWDFNEPWTNGAGSYLVDYDGRPLMNFAFARQAAGALSLSLRHESSLYDLTDGIRTTLYLSSDAPEVVDDLTWTWRARDRRGEVVGRGQGRVAIKPLEVKRLADIAIKLPGRTSFGPCVLELQLTDSQGRIVNERVQVFGLRGVRAPFRGLLDQSLLDPDDDPGLLQPLLGAATQTGERDASRPDVVRPVRRTNLRVAVADTRIKGEEEVMELTVTNTGAMTALFVEPKPLLNYRTDLLIDNLFVSIPPGESRKVSIRAPRRPRDGLTLGQTGCQVTAWNADPAIVEPASSVLLGVGRADRMNREFADPADRPPSAATPLLLVEGRFSAPARIPRLMDGRQAVEFTFDVPVKAASRGAILRIHSSDQAVTGAMLTAEFNEQPFRLRIPDGYGIQERDPGHLAKAQCTELEIPAGVLREKGNRLRLRAQGDGWYTWDALDLISLGHD